ncbi:multiple epidermal growth factor domains 10, partial [Biomphalaria glabrata]
CPSFRWGTNCIMSCENCVNDCDKFTGLCETCKAGFTDPATGCRKSCPDYTYGIDCKLSCIDVCSDDCFSRVTGQCYDVFEPWHEWHCSRSCLDTKAYRERVCDRSKPGSVCKGNKSESKESNCYVEITCPNNCDPFKWGDDCVYSCEHCEHDCEKFTGVCQQCKPGYKNPKKGCLEECGRFFYGYNCEGDCTLKCGADCAEKVYGRCSSGYEQYALLLVLLLLFAPCLFILFRKKRDHNVTKARRSSYMGKIGLMSRRVSHTPERASKAPTRSVKKKRSRRTLKDVRSWSSYDDDDDDEDDDDD